MSGNCYERSGGRKAGYGELSSFPGLTRIGLYLSKTSERCKVVRILLLVLTLLPSIVYSQDATTYLILGDIGPYKPSPGFMFMGKMVGQGPTTSQGGDAARGYYAAYKLGYEGIAGNPHPSVEVQVYTESLWLLHDVEEGYRDEERMNAVVDTNVQMRAIDGSNVFFIGIYGGKSYSWLAKGNIVVNIDCSSCPNTKPEPLDIVSAYLKKYPSTISMADADLKSKAHSNIYPRRDKKSEPLYMNRLANERSPYLQKAAKQKIDWYPWCDEAFARARVEKKPVFLSSGGVWCHWCHVMAQETFADDEVAAILNEHFISIKLDRDERPEIDRRYQQASALMGNQGGWPLSIFLTADRQPFFGGTYFPPDDRYGRPGFRKILRSVQEFYQSRAGDAEQYGSRLMEALAPEVLAPGDLDKSALLRAEETMLEHYDAENGGFGKAPKFPMPGVMEFLVRCAAAGSTAAAEAVKRTLDAMAAGGMHDQLAGGFHRYSVDEGWFIPHFEKMADDNAWLLRNYLDAYGLFGEERYRIAAEGIIDFVRETLSDPKGGFFASQDADVTPDDEGGYFTWTDEEVKQLLTDEEYQVLNRRFFHDRGRMHHAPDKRVLCQARGVQEIAAELKLPLDRVQDVLDQGRKKLLLARKERETPFIDRTLYTSLNCMFIASFLKAFRLLGRTDCRDFALTSLDRMLRERVRDGKALHVEGVPGLLDDHVYLIEALIAAYEATADRRYLDRGRGFMDPCLEQFRDPAGGFYDTDVDVLGTRLMGIEDIPHPSANGIAVLQLLKLYALTGREEYRAAAEASLRIFTDKVTGISIHGGAYYCGLDAWFRMVKLTVEASPESDLAAAARRIAGPATVIVYGEDRGRVIPCVNETCFEPVTDPTLVYARHASLDHL